jgi:hypothetical protein
MTKFDLEIFRFLVRPPLFVHAKEFRGQSRVRKNKISDLHPEFTFAKRRNVSASSVLCVSDVKHLRCFGL